MRMASRRSILAAAGIASLDIAGRAGISATAGTDTSNDSNVAALIKLSTDSNAALMRGDIDRYLTLMTFPQDFTLMSPFGGTPTRGSDLTAERLQAMGRFFRNGTLEIEVIQSYGSADMVVLAIIERARVEVGGLPLQDWALRVTLVYRRDGTAWQLVHRHADPLVNGISLQQSAALARGARTATDQP
jgi:ketosteroid isomerase-like protein